MTDLCYENHLKEWFDSRNQDLKRQVTFFNVQYIQESHIRHNNSVNLLLMITTLSQQGDPGVEETVAL